MTTPVCAATGELAVEDLLPGAQVQAAGGTMTSPTVLPLRDNSFDAVLFSDVLHHTEVFEDIESWLVRLVDMILYMFHF